MSYMLPLLHVLENKEPNMQHQTNTGILSSNCQSANCHYVIAYSEKSSMYHPLLWTDDRVHTPRELLPCT